MAWKAEVFQRTVQYGTHDRTLEAILRLYEPKGVLAGKLRCVIVVVQRRKACMLQSI